MRVATALAGIPVVVALTWLGGWPFAAMIALISVVAQMELYGLGERRVPPGVVVPAVAAGAAASLSGVVAAAPYVAIVLGMVALLAVPLTAPVERALPVASVTILGIGYPPALLGSLTTLRLSEPAVLDPFWVTLGIVVLVWAADTGAYYAGRSLGRHRLAPSLSPKKTWEGLIGGIVAAVLVATVWSYTTASGLAAMHWIAVALIASVLGPVGDLFESALKRSAGVKDSGSWLPGHGGMLDRFDALAFVAPAAWLYLAWLVTG